jgi:hypothetical protein
MHYYTCASFTSRESPGYLLAGVPNISVTNYLGVLLFCISVKTLLYLPTHTIFTPRPLPTCPLTAALCTGLNGPFPSSHDFTVPKRNTHVLWRQNTYVVPWRSPFCLSLSVMTLQSISCRADSQQPTFRARTLPSLPTFQSNSLSAPPTVMSKILYFTHAMCVCVGFVWFSQEIAIIYLHDIYQLVFKRKRNEFLNVFRISKAQAVSRRPLTTDTQVRSQACECEIRSG